MYSAKDKKNNSGNQKEQQQETESVWRYPKVNRIKLIEKNKRAERLQRNHQDKRKAS
jgi:uncharacterized protein RhaS with RHS repeats